jgi:nitrogenase molybdenum-iron protein beta chain
MAGPIERPRAACSLSGALVTMSAAPGIIPISHTALGCAGNLANAAAYGAGYFGSGYCSGGNVPSSGITEREVVFGGIDRLREEIVSARELLNAELFVVATGCMTEIIGDDVDGVIDEFEGDGGTPIIAINTPSFKGDAYRGYEILLDAVFNASIPPSGKKDATQVNLFGLVPAYDPFFRGDLEEIARILAKIGIKANTFFTPGQSFDNILSAPQAALNIVFSRVLLGEFAETFQKKHGVSSWITDLPIGAAASAAFLRQAGEKLGINQSKVNQAIKEENEYYYGYFERTADVFADSDFKFYAVNVTNANYAIPAGYFLQNELGWVPLEAFVTDELANAQKQRLKTAYDASKLPAELLFETDTTKISRSVAARHPLNQGQIYFDSDQPLFILGSSLEKPLAAARGAQHLSISFPVYNRVIIDRGYAGFRGGLHLLEDILGILTAPRGG